MLDFYILGDMGSGDIEQYIVSNAMKEHIGNKKTFVCGLGDNIYEKGCKTINDEQFITKFEDPYRFISDKIKFYMCIGNHDYGTYYGKGNSLNQIKYGIRSQKVNKKWYMPSNYYTYKKKNKDVSVEFFVIDTNLYNLTDKEIKKQFNEISEKLRNSNADWKIVYGHHTWRSVAGHGNADDNLETFLRDLYKNEAFDLYMCGHDHNKQIINMKMEDNSILPLIVCGTGGKTYHDLINFKNLDKNSKLIFYSNELGYGYLKAYKNKLFIILLDEKNNVEKIHSISKKNIRNSKMAKSRSRTRSRTRRGTRSRSRSRSRTQSRSRSRSRSRSKTRSRSRTRTRGRTRGRRSMRGGAELTQCTR